MDGALRRMRLERPTEDEDLVLSVDVYAGPGSPLPFAPLQVSGGAPRRGR